MKAKRSIFIFIFVLLALVSVLFPGLSGGNFPIDDAVSIQIPQLALPFGPKLLKALFSPLNHLDYLPIRDFSYWLDIHWFGAATQGTENLVFRIHNIVLFAISGVLLFQIFALLELQSLGFFVTLIWALHPIHQEMLMWANARKDVLALCLFLFATYSFIKYQRSHDRKHGILVILFFVMSLLSKGSYALAPLIALAFVRNQARQKSQRAALLWLTTTLLLLGFVSSLFQGWFYSKVCDMRFFYTGTYRLQGVAIAFARYFLGLVQNSYNFIDIENYGEWVSLNHNLVYIGILLIAASLALFLYAVRKKNRTLALYILSFFILYLPSAGLIFPHRNFYSVRYFEPALLVLTAGLVYFLSNSKTIRTMKKGQVSAAMAVLMIVTLASAIRGASDWHDNLAIIDKGLGFYRNNVALKYQKLVELKALNQWGRLSPAQHSDLDILSSEIEKECAPETRPISRNGDLCWSFWVNSISSGAQLKLNSRYTKALLENAKLLDSETFARFNAMLQFQNALSGNEDLKNASASFLKTKRYLTYEKMRYDTWLALCLASEQDEARTRLTKWKNSGLAANASHAVYMSFIDRRLTKKHHGFKNCIGGG
jgi:hypothetical protein